MVIVTMEQELWNSFKLIRSMRGGSWYLALAEMERTILQEALKEYSELSRQELAEWLGLKRTTLVMKLKLHGLSSRQKPSASVKSS